ncbi:helix-turn-helix domain-containing protein [Aquibacillus sediminis]|uniref:helix-turn-helix domain-containing protein n=1 Tax=Aquibacillus sediminis TaxID=2574734 RepID=UPI0014872A11|nr:helix-turn-helix domain-containing protein [Aquibacillus sediminis]
MNRGSLIKYHRQEKGVTQKQLAKGICSISYLSKIENETTVPSEEILTLLSQRLNICQESIKTFEFDPKLKQKMYKWYDYIKRKNREESNLLYEEITKSMSNNYNSELKTIYKLFSFRYFIYLNKLDQATEFLLELENVSEFFTEEQRYNYHKFTAMLLNKKGRLNEALEQLDIVDSINENLHTVDPELDYYTSIIYSRLNKLANSIIYANKALEIYQKSFDYNRVSDCCMILGINFNLLGDYEKAVYYMERMLSLGTEKSPKELAGAYHNLSYIHMNLEEYESALRYADKSIKLKENEALSINTIHLKSLIYMYKGNNEKAKTLANKGYLLAIEHQNKKFEYKFYVLNYRLDGCNFDQSVLEKLQNEVLSYFKELGELLEYRNLLKILGDVYYKNRLYKLSAQFYKMVTDTL